MSRTGARIAAWTGGVVLVTLLLILLLFNLGIRFRIQSRATEAIYDVLTWDDDYAPTLYYPEVIALGEHFQIEPEDSEFYTQKELELIQWCQTHEITDIEQIQIGVNTYYICCVEEESGWTDIVYVDITGEPEMITWFNIVFLATALLTGALGALGGYSLGKRLELSQQAQKRFFENTSHELKTPLTSIRGYAEGIEKGVITDYRKIGRVIAEQTEKMGHLVDEILCMAKLESGAMPIQKETMEIGEFLEDCLMPFEGMVASRALAVDLQLSPHEVQGDPVQLEHAITNLLSNAIKYAKSRIKIFNNARTLSIWNDCAPLTDEDLQHMFDRFYTGRYGSTGIGLSLAQDILRLHGWDVQATWQNGGLCMTVTMA